MAGLATILPRATPIDSSVYVTDGVHLFRVVAAFTEEHPENALLEDCLTLEVRSYRSGELAEMPLRSVDPSEEAR